MRNIDEVTRDFMEKSSNCTDEERRQLLRQLSQSFSTAMKHSEDKVTLACQTYDIVDKHIRRLDEDLMKFEDELTMTGPKIAHPRYAGLKEADLLMKRDSPGRKRKAVREQPSVPQHNGLPTAPRGFANSAGLPPVVGGVRKERKRESSVTAVDYVPDSPMVATAQLPVPRKSRNAAGMEIKQRKNSSAG
jgi:hypothetical protein